MKSILLLPITFLSFFGLSQNEYEVTIREGINIYFSSQIDSMFKLDQKIRKQRKYMKPFRVSLKYYKDTSLDKNDPTYVNAQKVMRDWDVLDSSNMANMLYLIEKFGFPSVEKVSRTSYYNSYIMFLHFVTKPNYGELQIILDSALKQGEISPYQYADITDRNRVFAKKEPLYYCRGFCDYPKLSDEHKKKISVRRRSIGLNPQKAKCGTFKKSFIIY